ncbi:probable serine/threonine-protein kinase DDB_G0282963 [Condylostylus longicornis]|uniref:probable serine/threonine-protein kinase DDB_G0282963 n=1 Tax=Condylostylus longicornis TaxID=2530218 RepID=UPI00244DCE41|nr:probable serine/threonine-protein kinase DDB_G0282963 [Condylostylus longicornis]
MQPTKIISTTTIPAASVPCTATTATATLTTTTKIARPNTLTGIRQPINTIASLKKSFTGEKFTEAANLMSQKTTTAVRKFLTKPEKSEKNIETKRTITNLEKGSKEENSNEKLQLNQKSRTILPNEKQHQQPQQPRSILTRSETFVRDDNTNNDDDDVNNDGNCNNESVDCPNSTIITTAKTIPADLLGHTYDIIEDECNDLTRTTRMIRKTQQQPRYSLFDTSKDLIQSTPRIDNVTKILDKTNLINDNLRINNTQLLESASITTPGITNITTTIKKPLNPIINSTQNSDQIYNNATAAAFLTRTFENTVNEDYLENTLPISPLKPLRRSETFSQIPNTEDHPLLDENYFNETQICERLTDKNNSVLNATLILSNHNDDNNDFNNDYLEKTLTGNLNDNNESLLNKTLVIDNNTITIAPDKKDMKLQLNSTIQNNLTPNERIIDITTSISPRNHLMNLTRGLLDSPPFKDIKNQTALLYMSPQTELKHSILAPRKASSRASLAKTPDDLLEPMDIDQYGNVFDIPMNVKQALSMNALQELKQNTKPRFSFGLDLTESTLDCSIELCDISLASNAPSASIGPGGNINSCNGISSSSAQIDSPGTLLKKQNSFDLDESLGILTPDQMKEFLDSTTTNNTNNLDLPGLIAHHSSNINGLNFNGKAGSKLSLHQMRIDLTPSPEELPLDPVDVKTDLDILMSLPMHNIHHNNNCITQSQILPSSNTITYTELSQTDTESKTDQMTKSNTSKVSTSFITSVTSITSLDNGYQGDGEMSRPASRGGDHSPSNGPKNKNQISRQPSFNNQHQNILVRRQDPMTDSDFFTESDADVDIFHRGDRRAQVIDGQLYGPMHQQAAANVFISEQPEMEDSCMESSGIFTDVENRCDDDLALNRRDAIESAAKENVSANTTSPNSLLTYVTSTTGTCDIDMSPDGSTDTVKSNKNDTNLTSTSVTTATTTTTSNHSNSDRSITPSSSLLSQGQYYGSVGGCSHHSGNLLTDSQTSTINSSFSSDRISISTDYNITATTATTATTTTATTKRKVYNVRSSPTSNATSPTTVYSKPITEKRAATSPLLSAAKIKASNNKMKTNTTIKNYCGGGGGGSNSSIGETMAKSPAFKNSLKSIAHSSVSVRKSSPSRKHVLATTSSSVRPSPSSLLSSSPSQSLQYLNKNKQLNSVTKSNKTVNSNNHRKKLSLGLIGNSSSSIVNDYQSPQSCSSTTSPQQQILSSDNIMVLNSKNNLVNGISIKTKNTVNTRNISSNQENINHQQNSITANSSNNSSSISISTGSNNLNNNSNNNCNSNCNNNDNNVNLIATQNHYRSTKFPPNKWDAVMNKIAENKNNQQKLVKKSYNQVKSKISTGIKIQLQQQQQDNIVNNKKNLCSNINSVNNSLNNDNNSGKNENQNGAHHNNLNKENLIKVTTKIQKKLINCNNVVVATSPNSSSSVNSSFDCSANTSGLTSPQTKRLIQGAIKR